MESALLALLLCALLHAAAVHQCQESRGNNILDGDFTSFQSTNTSLCCEFCQNTAGCAGYTWWNFTCYMKDRISATEPCKDCVSATVATQPFCTYKNGSDAAPDQGYAYSFKASEASSCCDACTQMVSCVAWTFFESRCYLKNTFERFTGCPKCISGLRSSNDQNATKIPKKWNIRGITFTGGRYCPEVKMGSNLSTLSLQHLASTGANWVAIVVTQYQWRINSTDIFPLYNVSEIFDTASHYYKFVTISDIELEDTIKQAQSLGLQVLLKPHVDLLRDNKPLGRFWRGDIGGCPHDWDPSVERFTSNQWDKWFKSYEQMILHYSKIAERLSVEMLSLNCELYCANREDSRWRKIAKSVRSMYGGMLTVAQIKGHETEMKWWDVVDIIGIDAYYPIKGDTIREMVRSWGEYRDLAWSLHDQYSKPVVYTEIGYCSGQCSRNHTPNLQDYTRHAMHYQAVFEAFSNATQWFKGVFWWNWNTDPGSFESDDCLTPQFKPAEDVLRIYWNSTFPKPNATGLPHAKCIGKSKCTC